MDKLEIGKTYMLKASRQKVYIVNYHHGDANLYIGELESYDDSIEGALIYLESDDVKELNG